MMALMLLLVGLPLLAVAVACGLALKARLGWAWFVALCALSAAPGIYLLGTFLWDARYWGSGAMQAGLMAMFFVPVAALAGLLLLVALADEALRRHRASRPDNA